VQHKDAVFINGFCVCDFSLFLLVMKVKFSLYLGDYPPYHEDVCESGGMALPFLALTLDGGEWSASHPIHFTSRESAPSIHWT
jgi:hypothetical protein